MSDSQAQSAAGFPDPMRGLRGVYAAVLTLEAIVVLLSLLVLPKFGDGASPPEIAAIVALAAALLVVAGLQRLRWGLAGALVLQAAVIAAALLVPALVVVGMGFLLVWGGILLLRRDVARKMARGELPAQRLQRDQDQ